MQNKPVKKHRDSFYGFAIDISFLDSIFQTPYAEETIDIDYEDVTNKRKELSASKGHKKRYRKDKSGNVFFRLFSL